MKMEKLKRDDPDTSTIMWYSSAIFTSIMLVVVLWYSYSVTDFGEMGNFLFGTTLALLLNMIIMGSSVTIITLYWPNSPKVVPTSDQMI